MMRFLFGIQFHQKSETAKVCHFFEMKLLFSFDDLVLFSLVSSIDSCYVILFLYDLQFYIVVFAQEHTLDGNQHH